MTKSISLPRLLLVEDSQSTAMVYATYLEHLFDVTVVYTGTDAIDALHRHRFQLAVMDVQLPDISGLEVLKTLRERDQQLPVVIITAHSTVEVAVDAMRLGANDFLTKPFDKTRLQHTLQQVLKTVQLSSLVETYEKTFDRSHFYNMVGASLPMQAVYRIIESAASSKATVFITGESGTGKELCAEALHRESPRSKKPFIALNCAAIPLELMESEIFGHIKGAFSGASQNREGAAQRAHGGTLFLDEIGEMPLSLQSKLLRFIQLGTFQAVGSNQEVTVDVRFVCATNRDPLTEVRAGRFREDLFYRLNVIPVHMPPLRERGQDILRIANAFLRLFNEDEGKSFQSISRGVEERLMSYRWPGNVRELANVLRNMVVLNQGRQIETGHLPDFFQQQEKAPAPRAATIPEVVPAITAATAPVAVEAPVLPLWLEEKRIIERAINHYHGNIPKAAAMLDISASTIYRKKQFWAAQDAEQVPG
ncbi:sigma-54 dependent transcriptional regulator [Oceanobacter sp. 5_MG-2023]|uniref:sigma-54-dependent transcriptional regulator n=1 Tax=Oceanobacter sp. 5_MG-2023 TaxID=3062645 RepID=UPI0026E42B48|nr:sigma-54 dependent transcriptional regulator [Oceanobacter sp. 5_MG-2023]MDO6681489.1 sigma-54 dependent transcriptional regulator [Oceanobacter sp. 5_MG-2023]